MFKTLKKKFTFALIMLACALCCICFAACRKAEANLTFRHYVAEDTVEIGSKYLLNRNNAFDKDGDAYTPVITVKRGQNDITDQVNDYVLDVTQSGDFTVTYTFSVNKKKVKKGKVTFTTEVKVVDKYAPQIILGADLPDELEYEGELTMPEILVIDNSGEQIVPDVKVYGNSVEERNLIDGTDGVYVMPSDVKKAFVDISATDGQGNTEHYKKTIRVRRKGEKNAEDVSGTIRYFSSTDSTIVNDGSETEYVYCLDTVNGVEDTEILTVETTGAFITTFPTLVFNLPNEYRANCVISLDLYAENMSEWMSVFPLYNGSGAAPEYGLRNEGFAEGCWVHISNVFKPTEAAGYNPNGKIDSIRLTFPGRGTNGQDAIVDASKGIVLKVANLTVSEVPEREDLSDLGLVGNISENGSFFVNYPFATTSKGVLSDGNTDALKITIPADTEIKHSTLIFDLDKTYPVGSIVSFDWEVQNMDLDALVSGYDAKGMATEEIHITGNQCVVALSAKKDYAGEGFNKVALYLRFDMDKGGYTGGEITMLIGNLTVREQPERGDYPELGFVNDISENGSFFVNYPFATKTKGELNGTPALKLTIPAEAKRADATLIFDLDKAYPAGSIVSFDWQAENAALNALVSGYDGNSMATEEVLVTTNRCNATLSAKASYSGDGFNKIALFLRFKELQGSYEGDITILIANLTIREAPERGDYPELGLVNDISENGSFFTNYPSASKTKGELSGGTAALKLTVPADAERKDATLIFDLDKTYRAGSIVSFDWAVENAALNTLVSGYDGNSMATAEVAVTTNRCNVTLTGGDFNKVALYLRLNSLQGEHSGEIVILIANLAVEEAPERGDYPELGFVNDISENGSFFTNYPSASKTKGELDGTPALKLTIPADATRKPATLIFDLDKTYRAGSTVSFDWAVTNAALATSVSGYNGSNMSTVEIPVTTNHCSVALTGGAFNKVSLYLNLAQGEYSGEITILIANLAVEEAPERGDYPELGFVNDISENGSFFTNYPSASKTKGEIDGTAALKLTIPADATRKPATLIFDLDREYRAGSTVSFDWAVTNAALATSVSGYNGSSMTTVEIPVTTNHCNVALTGGAFNKVSLYLNLAQGEYSGEITILIANLEVEEAPERGDYPELGFVNSISENGSFFTNYPSASKTKGEINGTPALKLTIPADATRKPATLIFDLDREYRAGSTVSFDWAVTNAALATSVSGYNGSNMATVEIPVTTNHCNVALTGGAFNKVSLYLNLAQGEYSGEIVILIANLAVEEAPERGDYPELGLVNDISENGSFFTNYPSASKTKGEIDGTPALKLTIPADATRKPATLIFDLDREYRAGSTVSFDWAVTNAALATSVSGYDGSNMATVEIPVTTNHCNVALTGGAFNKVSLYLNLAQGEYSGEITILIANLEVEEAPERGDYPELGFVNDISENGSFFTNYPSASKTKGEINGTPALKLTIPADAERKDVTLIFDLDKTYPAGSIVSFDWAVENAALDALVSGYASGEMATEQVHVTGNHCSAVLTGDAFNKVAFYLRLKTLQGDCEGEFTILIANLEVEEAPERGDYSELGLVNDISESGSFFTNYIYATKTKGELDGENALKLTVPEGATRVDTTLMFDLGATYPVGSIVSFDWAVENATLNALVSGYDASGMATTEALITTKYCRVALPAKENYDGDGFNKIALYLRLGSIGSNYEGEFTILIKNLRVEDLSVLGDLGSIGSNGNRSSAYPSALFSVGKIGDADALELTIPKGTELPANLGELTFDLALSTEYPVGSVIEFVWEVENTSLYTIATGYNGGAVTTGVSITQRGAFMLTKASAGAEKNTFKNILFYFQLNRGENNENINADLTLKDDIKIRFTGLKITPPSELEALGGALGLDMTQSTFVRNASTTIGIGALSDGTKALEITVSPTDLGQNPVLWFELPQSYKVGSVVSFKWEVENMPLITYINGYNGGTVATAQTAVWKQGAPSITPAPHATPQETFNYLYFWFNMKADGFTVDTAQPIVLKITAMEVVEPEHSIDTSSPLLTANSTVEKGKLSDGTTDCFVISIPKAEYYANTVNNTTWKILYLNLDKEYAANTTVKLKMEYSGFQKWNGNDLALKWGGDYGGAVSVDGGFVGYNGETVELEKTIAGTFNKLQFTFLRVDYTEGTTPADECVIIKIAVASLEANA